MSKIITVDVASRQFSNEQRAAIYQKYQMPLPHQMELHLTDTLIAKLNLMATFSTTHNLSLMQTIASTRKDLERSHSVVLYNGYPVRTSQYQEDDRWRDTFDSQAFYICVESFNPGLVRARFDYFSENDCFEFFSKDFKI